MTQLYRSESDKILGGVCGGIAEVYDLDPSLVRIATLVLIFSGISPFLYLIAWIIIPSESEVKNHKNVKDVEAEKVEDEEESSNEEEE